MHFQNNAFIFIMFTKYNYHYMSRLVINIFGGKRMPCQCGIIINIINYYY